VIQAQLLDRQRGEPCVRDAGPADTLSRRIRIKINQWRRRDTVFAFHDGEEIGPRMLARIAKRTGLRPEDL
jgi:hypothetical protein